ncbi:MAG: replication-associated recombination protein A [Firmicutes bacterium]|nr:replication-associated recombination protein A [Bacillota bacterium]
MYEPLASVCRPKTFEEVIGQKKVISIIQKLIKEDKMISLILYGPTGTGKTTIALLIANAFPLNHFKFNASTDSKQTLRQIVESAKHYGNVLLIIDEIHRMNKDIQDYLLPYVETGQIIMIGLTTENPYIACNPAIRSRASIFKLERPSSLEINEFLKKIDLNIFEKEIQLLDEIYEYISVACNGEVRTALNMLELVMIQAEKKQVISLDFAKEIVGKPALSIDKSGDNYYDILSAFHKSVRGSDTSAALHYLARLIVAEDLESLLRRISAIVYEDIGLANPAMGPKVAAVCDICRHIGFPEAINALGAITIEMCISPKSNSAHLAVNKAIDDVLLGKTYKVLSHLINNPTYDDKKAYLYAHDYLNHIVSQQYLPDELKDVEYYIPQTHSKLENMLKEQYLFIQNSLRKK